MRHVIIGNGPAGVNALRAIREIDHTSEVLVISDEPHAYYSKVLLTYLVAGKVSLDRVFLASDIFYRDLAVLTMFGRRVAKVLPEERSVLLANGERVKYDKLLLAMGSSPSLPQIPGVRLPGVYCLRTLDDALAIKRASSGAQRAVIVGGGLVSLKAAEALAAKQIKVSLVVTSNRLLSQITTNDDATIVRELVESAGIEVITNCDVVELCGSSCVNRAVLSTGRDVACDLVIIGKGVKPNTGALEGTGIAVRDGVIVDHNMRTSIPGIYAAGDIAEAPDVARGKHSLNALWSSAVWQGRVAGYNMAGLETTYPGDISMNSFSFGSGCVTALGKTQPEDGDEIIVYTDKNRDDYRRFVFSQGQLVGALLAGRSTMVAGLFRSLIAKGAKMYQIGNALREKRVSYPGLMLNMRNRFSYSASWR